MNVYMYIYIHSYLFCIIDLYEIIHMKHNGEKTKNNVNVI